MNELILEAKTENLDEVLTFVGRHLKEKGCVMRTQVQIIVAVEELFVNISRYAYQSGTGRVTIRMEAYENPDTVSITFIDSGVPFNPLAKEDPDITLSAEERPIGGLGIYMVKKSMNDISYEYRDGQNILCMKKNI
ncbi:MAG: ATP-binding protein [Acetatifactor sp.]